MDEWERGGGGGGGGVVGLRIMTQSVIYVEYILLGLRVCPNENFGRLGAMKLIMVRFGQPFDYNYLVCYIFHKLCYFLENIYFLLWVEIQWHFVSI